ncbi:MAG TPA: hypothetical protein VG326_10325 [Tepidisphaeraceae bacterium]|nr:hypothetical protein [Tepidisphaeraceae bacterium]
MALLDGVPKTEDNASDEYVLLGGAIDASKEAGDLDLCFKAADAMASQYQVDGLSVKADAALKTDLRGGSPEAAAENVRTALDLVDHLVSDDDFRTAQRIIVQVRLAATRNAELTALVQRRAKAVETLRVAHDRAQIAAEKLKSSPNDPAANLVVGAYLCFGKRDWTGGVPLLARSGEANLKRLAAMEISRPDKLDDIIQLGDGWWETAAHQPDANRTAIRQHAASFYKSALKNSTGLQHSLLERRIAEASAARRLPLPPGSEETIIKKFVGEFLGDDHGPFFKIDSPDVPDVLTVDIRSGKFRIFGIKKVNGDAPAVLGRPSGWLGKAVLLRLPEARGTITVSAIDGGAAYRYYIMLIDRKGSTRFSLLGLKMGAMYTWSVSRTDTDVTFAVTVGDETVGSVTTPIGDFCNFAFATTVRSGGAHLDMEITIDDPRE